MCRAAGVGAVPTRRARAGGAGGARGAPRARSRDAEAPDATPERRADAAGGASADALVRVAIAGDGRGPARGAAPDAVARARDAGGRVIGGAER